MERHCWLTSSNITKTWLSTLLRMVRIWTRPRAAQAIQEAEALFSQPVLAWVSTLVCLISGNLRYLSNLKKTASFIDLANPRWFRDDPRRAWGFTASLRLYRRTVPHQGFHLINVLKDIPLFLSPPTWMVSFKRRVSMLRISTNATVRSIICNAASLVPLPFGQLIR